MTTSSDEWDQGPRLAKSAHIEPGGDKRWAAAWEFYNIAFYPDVVYRELDASSPVGFEAYSVVEHTGANREATVQGVSSRLDAADGSGGHLVVWTRELPSGETELRSKAVGTPGVLSNQHTFELTPGTDHHAAAVDADGSTFVVAFEERAPGGPGSLHLASLDSLGLFLNRTELLTLAGPDALERRPALTSTHSGGGGHGLCLVVWDEVGPGLGDVHGALYETPGPGTPYCIAAPNSVGPGARISASGSKSLAANELTLRATGAPPHQPAVFYLGLTGLELPFGEGFRCVGAPIHRLLPPLAIGATGEISLDLDLGLPLGGLVHPGLPGVRYQLWYRDPAGGPAAFNLSDALHVEHRP